MLGKLFRDEGGATAIEYGLIAAIIGVGIHLSLDSLQSSLTTLYSSIGTNLN